MADAGRLKAGRAGRAMKRSDLIAEQIKRWILTEKMQPGTRLPQEKELLTLFHGSKGTIREALKSLEVQGLIAVRTGPAGGPYVAEVSFERSTGLLRNYLHFQTIDARQVYAIRKAVEVELAANVVGRLNDDDFAQLEQNLGCCADPHAHDNSEVRELELDFHVILANRCDNPLLAFLSRFLGDLLRDFLRFKRERLPEFAAFTESNVHFHRLLLAAYRAKDEAAVRRIMREHMEEAESKMLALEGYLSSDLLLPL